MPDIFQTTAIISDDFDNSKIVKISQLSGRLDHSELLLYIESHLFDDFSIAFRPNLRLEVYAKVKSNHLNISCDKVFSPLYKSDTVTINFKGGASIEKSFSISRSQSGKYVTNFLLLSDHELFFLEENEIDHIVITNKKALRPAKYVFIDIPNDQYNTADDGRALLKIIVKRIIGAKKLLLNSLLK